MTSVLAILDACQLPWFEVQSSGSDSTLWVTVFEQRLGKGRWPTSDEAWKALERLVQRFPHLPSFGKTYRIICPQTGEVAWQGPL